jgi:glycosyltransferase involved in cell wall biosynthesis
MRAVILYNTSWYVFLLRRNLIKALQQHGWTITVVAPVDAYTERVKKLGVEFYPLAIDGSGKNVLTEAKTLLELYKALRVLRPDVVLSFTVKCNLYAGLCRRFMRFRQIANVSGLGEGFERPGLLATGLRTMYSVALRHTDQIFFQNPDDLNACLRQKMVPRRSARLVPGSGVDLSLFLASTQPMGARRSFLMFGRLLPKKGFYHYLRAAASLKETWGDSASFLIMGSADTTRPDSMQLLAAIKDAHEKGTITYLAPRDEVLPVLQSADVVVLPSTYNEGIPRSLLEALGCGKPIVTTNWKGCREVVKEGSNGHLVEPDDVKSLRDALEKMLEYSDDRLAAMGNASRQLAEERFDERQVIDAYLEALPNRSPVFGKRKTALRTLRLVTKRPYRSMKRAVRRSDRYPRTARGETDAGQQGSSSLSRV